MPDEPGFRAEDARERAVDGPAGDDRVAMRFAPEQALAHAHADDERQQQAVEIAAPAHAQLGSLQGRVVDEQGQPVPDATVTLEYSGELTYKFEVKTDAEGRWTRAGLMAVGGRWTITATKDGKAGYASNVEVPLNSAATVPEQSSAQSTTI